MTGVFHLLLPAMQSLQVFPGPKAELFGDVIIKGTGFLLLAGALALSLRRASAASRHLVWALALSALLALPVLALMLPTWKVPIFPQAPAVAASEQVTIEGGFAALPQALHLVPANAAQQPDGPSWPGGLLLLGVAGSALFVARMVVGETRVRKLAARSQRFESSAVRSILEEISRRLLIRRAVQVRTSAEIAIPFTRGVFRPAVFLPEGASRWRHEQLELVLAHELAHVHRHDHLTQIPAQIACALLWFHPLVWFAAFQMRKERERACDDLVLSLGHRATDYGEFLLLLGRSLRWLQPVWSTGLSMAQPSQLEVRMKALLNPRLNHRPLTARAVTLAAVLTIALLVPAAAIHATAKGSTGSITGNVFGSGQEAISGAKATLTDLRTLKQVSTSTDRNGWFEFSNIRVGGYRLEVTKPGYVTVVLPAIGVAASRKQVFVTINPRSEGKASTPSHVPHRIRVGGQVEARKLIYRRPLKYPPLAKAAGIQGKIILEAIIAKDGTVKDLRVLSGRPLLVKAAMDSVRHWRFKPTHLNGVPVEVATTVKVNFALAK